MDFRIAVFVVGSLGLLYLSREVLRTPQSHGFYRFFAWESVLGVVALNLDVWFRDPLAFQQIISWLLLGCSLFLIIDGLLLLIRRGRPDPNREDPGLFKMERTTALVTTGVYRYIRHPLYGSLLLLAWGAFFKEISWAAGALVLAASFFLWMTARAEEIEDLRYFGPAYGEYMQHTKRFIPFIF